MSKMSDEDANLFRFQIEGVDRHGNCNWAEQKAEANDKVCRCSIAIGCGDGTQLMSCFLCLAVSSESSSADEVTNSFI